MPLSEVLPSRPALAVNQGRNNETRSTTVAAPAILSGWDSRAASKLNPGIGVPLLTGGALAGLGAAPPAGALQRGHEAEPSATWLPHSGQNICLPPELAAGGARTAATALLRRSFGNRRSVA